MATPVTNTTADPIVYTADGADNAWVLVSSALVFQMIPALGLFYGGLTNSKNILNTIMLSMVCAGIISIQVIFRSSIHPPVLHQISSHLERWSII
jgi:hypothetical protein